MSPVTQAIQRGIQRGRRLTRNPSLANFQSLKTPLTDDITTRAWNETVEEMVRSMESYTVHTCRDE